MAPESLEAIRAQMTSTTPDELRLGLSMVRQAISRVGSRDARPLFEMVSSIFYIDPLDHPEMVSVLDEAVSLVVGFGGWVIPALVEQLDAGDVKAQLAIGHALGRIGVDAIEPLMESYRTSPEVGRRTFVLYALGKIKSPRIVQCVPLALEAARSENLELRDTATRAIGKFIESIPPSDLPGEMRAAIVERLHQNVADTSSGIRAKAVRSLGKLAKLGHLDGAERARLGALLQRILGKDERFEWDRAYIVRKEAEDAIRYV
jgi:HEAT repeat protein